MDQQKTNFRSGFVTIVGRPNVGKSSLINALIGEKIAIVSNRPQTTRSRMMGVMTKPGFQIVFLDTPGIHDPRTRLGEYMMRSVREAMDGMDCVLMMLDVTHITENDLKTAEDILQKKVPAVLALNKIDLVRPDEVLAATAKAAEIGYSEIVPVSAKSGDGLAELTACLDKHLPAGPQYFPDDMITDQPERVLCAEIIREKALRNLRDEVPHGIGVEIIGKHGAMLQTIGSEARADIERLLDTHVNLKLWVKIRPDWRNNLSDLKNLGYESK